MLELIDIAEEHTDFILELNNNPAFADSFPNRKITKEGHLKFLELLKKTDDKYFIIYYEDRPIGTVSIYDVDKANKRAEWGRFIILDGYRSMGLPVSKLILKIAFDAMELNRLYCTILASNLRTVKFNKLLGFKEEGILRRHVYKDGKYLDMYYLGLLRSEYEQRANSRRNN